MGLGNVTMGVWAADILSAIGAPHTQNNVNNLAAWQACEGGSAGYNPFNTTLPAGGAGNYNSAGVKSYPSYKVGLNATVSTMKQGNMAAIVRALRADSNRSTFAAAVGGSPWGTSGSCIASSRAAGGMQGGSGTSTGGGGSGGGSIVTTAAIQTYSAANCIWTFPGVQVPFLGNVGQFCLLSKSEVRSWIGAGLMFVGLNIAGGGLAVIALDAGLHLVGPLVGLATRTQAVGRTAARAAGARTPAPRPAPAPAPSPPPPPALVREVEPARGRHARPAERNPVTGGGRHARPATA